MLVFCHTIYKILLFFDRCSDNRGGGVSDGQTAYEKIVSGSSLVQLYTGIVYNGFKSAYKINRELDSILKSNGFDSVEEAVGSDV